MDGTAEALTNGPVIDSGDREPLSVSPTSCRLLWLRGRFMSCRIHRRHCQLRRPATSIWWFQFVGGWEMSACVVQVRWQGRRRRNWAGVRHLYHPLMPPAAGIIDWRGPLVHLGTAEVASAAVRRPRAFSRFVEDAICHTTPETPRDSRRMLQNSAPCSRASSSATWVWGRGSRQWPGMASFTALRYSVPIMAMA